MQVNLIFALSDAPLVHIYQLAAYLKNNTLSCLLLTSSL